MDLPRPSCDSGPATILEERSGPRSGTEGSWGRALPHTDPGNQLYYYLYTEHFDVMEVLFSKGLHVTG
ncbi:unnamed protein product [Lepidochelys olivacea]